MAHSYADDTQIYLSIASKRTQEAVDGLSECVYCVDYLDVQQSPQTQHRQDSGDLVGHQTTTDESKHQRHLPSVQVGSMFIGYNNLGVHIDLNLFMRDVLYPRETPALQNVAARLVLGLRKFDHISGAIRGLQRLPVRQKIDYKVALLTFKFLHGLAPPYLVR